MSERDAGKEELRLPCCCVSSAQLATSPVSLSISSSSRTPSAEQHPQCNLLRGAGPELGSFSLSLLPLLASLTSVPIVAQCSVPLVTQLRSASVSASKSPTKSKDWEKMKAKVKWKESEAREKLPGTVCWQIGGQHQKASMVERSKTCDSSYPKLACIQQVVFTSRKRRGFEPHSTQSFCFRSALCYLVKQEGK
jgi:hypothetical protein